MIEITGQPCAGKSYLIEEMVAMDVGSRIYRPSIIGKILNFGIGCFYLRFYRTIVLFKWSFHEVLPFLFKCNIFFNAVCKFGCYYRLNSRGHGGGPSWVIDEGVSHLPFLLCSTDCALVVNFIMPELKGLVVRLVVAPNQKVLRTRLISRGHKRLKYVSIDDFLRQNCKVETTIRESYPRVCLYTELS